MRTIPLFGMVGIAFTLAACGRDSVGPSPTPSTIAGTYTINTLDGVTLPVTVIDLGAYQAKLASGTLGLISDGTYSLELTIRIEDSGNMRTVTQNDGGHWNIENRTVTLTSTQSSYALTGTVSGNTMTLQNGTRVFGLMKHRE